MQNGNNMMLRRNLLKNTALGLGLGVGSMTGIKGPTVQAAALAVSDNAEPRLPRDVWLACVSCVGIEARDPDDMIAKMLGRMDARSRSRPSTRRSGVS
jgi:hypothetical protein